MHFCLHLKRKYIFYTLIRLANICEHNCRGNERQSLYSFTLLKKNAQKFKCSTIYLFVLNIKKLRKSFMFAKMKAKLLSTWMYVLFYSYIYKWWWHYDCCFIKYLSFKRQFRKKFWAHKNSYYMQTFSNFCKHCICLLRNIRMEALRCSAVVICQSMPLCFIKLIGTETSYKSRDEGTRIWVISENKVTFINTN